MRRPLALLVSLIAALVALTVFGRRSRQRRQTGIRTEISDPDDSTQIGVSTGVRSVQAADLTLPEHTLEALWTPMHLERLARTYWRFLSRATLGLIRVLYTDRERFVVLLGRPLVLLSFHAPEYEMSAERGIVRWRIDKGVLVARARRGQGYLQIDVRRCPPPEPGRSRVHVEVEVANFYPSIASEIGGWVYTHTQSRVHVIVTHGFLRSLQRLDLAKSRVGRWVPNASPSPDRPAPPAAAHDKTLSPRA